VTCRQTMPCSAVEPLHGPFQTPSTSAGKVSSNDPRGLMSGRASPVGHRRNSATMVHPARRTASPVATCARRITHLPKPSSQGRTQFVHGCSPRSEPKHVSEAASTPRLIALSRHRL
jgi:hypothetical protein